MNSTTLAICAWCGKTISGNPFSDSGGKVSPGICATCIEAKDLLPVEHLLSLSDAEVDQLPFGFIQLDAEGVVLRYNQFEANLACLDRSQVLGRHFFREVAPCTGVREFEGRYREMVAQGVDASARLEFLFRFAHGDRLVDIALVWTPDDLTGNVLVKEKSV